MATTVPFGKRNAPKPVTAPSGGGDGMIPPELDTDPRRNINPKTQSGGVAPKLSAFLRKRGGRTVTTGGSYG